MTYTHTHRGLLSLSVAFFIDVTSVFLVWSYSLLCVLYGLKITLEKAIALLKVVSWHNTKSRDQVSKRVRSVTRIQTL